MTTSAIPQFHEKRMSLIEIANQIREQIGGPDVVDIGKTMAVMLGDYFYGEPIDIQGQNTYTVHDRTLVFAQGKLPSDITMDSNLVLELLGDTFWALENEITSRVMRLSADYTHRPHECFYKFFPETYELVVYTPIMANFVYATNFAAIDGRAVVTTCLDTLPSYMRTSLEQ